MYTNDKGSDKMLLKPLEAAKILNVSIKTLQRWDKNNKLKAFRYKASDRRYYTQDQINEFLKGNENDE